MTRVTAIASLLLAAAASAQTPSPTWVVHYDGPSGHHDEPVRIAPVKGGVLVAGRSYSPATLEDFTLLKYSSKGELLWAAQFDGPESAADLASDMLPAADGGAFVCGYSDAGGGWHAVLVRYDARGTLLWQRFVPAGVFTASGPRLAQTPDGALRMGFTSNGAFLVASFEADGTPGWIGQMDPFPGEEDTLTGIAVDSAGNTVVTGPAGSGLGGFVTAKLAPDGTVLWAENEFSDFGSSLGGSFVAIDANDEIVVSAVAESLCGLFQARTWRLAPDGSRMWTLAFPESPCDSAEVVDMALDADGNAVVLCQSLLGFSGGAIGFATLKYDPDGNEVWRNVLDHGGADIPSALDIDPAGNIHITGAAGFSDSSSRGFAGSYAPDGALRWTMLFDGVQSPADVVAGSRGEVYLTGAGYGQSADIVTVKIQESKKPSGRK